MLQSRTQNLRLLKVFSLAVIILGIVVFAIIKSLNYAKGPDIHILEPNDGFSTSSTTIKISGIAYRINKITLNGTPIDIDELGNWNERVIILPGLNKITIRAEDQFQRTVTRKLDIVGQTNQY